MTVSRNAASVKPKRLAPLSYRAAARALDVSVGHLWLTLNGHRQSKSLTRRYAALVKNHSDN